MNSSLTTFLRRTATTGFVAAGVVLAGAAAAHAASPGHGDSPDASSALPGPSTGLPLHTTLDLTGSSPRIGLDLDAGVASIHTGTPERHAEATPIPAPTPHTTPRTPLQGSDATPKAQPRPSHPATPTQRTRRSTRRPAQHPTQRPAQHPTRPGPHVTSGRPSHQPVSSAEHSGTTTRPDSPTLHARHSETDLGGTETDWWSPRAEDTAGAAVPSTVLPASSYSVDGPVSLPLPAGTFTDLHNFGDRSPLRSSWHTGTDLSAPCGTPVLAATAGTVQIETDQPWAGRWLVKVTTGVGRLTTWYAHMQALTVRSGQRVQPGDQLGQVGDLGNATGCHLHFEVHPTGGSIYQDPVNPSDWLAEYAGKPIAHQPGHPTPYSVPRGAVGQSHASDPAALELPSLLGETPDQSAPEGDQQ